MILIAGVAVEKVDFSARSRIGVAKSSSHHLCAFWFSWINPFLDSYPETKSVSDWALVKHWGLVADRERFRLRIPHK
jgi:hypothetical protein